MQPDSSAGPSSGGSTSSPNTSTGGRQRGYSLRRTLFNKTANATSDMPEPVIELGEIQPVETISASSDDVAKQSFDARADEVLYPYGRGVHIQTCYGFGARPPRPRLLRKLDAIRHGLGARIIIRRAHNIIKPMYTKTRKFILRISELPPSKDGRHIEVDATRKTPLIDERTGRPHINNLIRSSRYNAYNFLPRQLFAQFSRVANFYFLCVSILQMIPGLSTTGTYTTILPLLFFVSISMAKEGYDDFRRHRLDKEENNRETMILHAYKPTQTDGENQTGSGLGPIHWASTKWKNVHVGDIVRLNRDEAAPADLIVLHNKGENGVAYIETMALDGETNLKSKQATKAVSDCCDSLQKLAIARPHVVVEDPNLDLYNFEGRVTVAGEVSPLTSLEVIYRGSILRNTPELVGLVVYSGEECKIRMNASKNARIKAPSLQAVVNKIVVCICVFVVLLAVFLSVGYEIWNKHSGSQAWYLRGERVSYVTIIVSFIIMFNTMIPLSLYVSMEIIKVFQMLLLNDIDMYDEHSDTPLEARTSTINEELGQISHIFTDKTGTLTDNQMKFRKLSVAGTAWLHDTDLQVIGAENTPTDEPKYGKRHPRQSTAMREESGKLPEKSRRSDLFAYVSPTRASADISHEEDRPGWKSSARPGKAQHEMHTYEMIRYMQRKPNTIFAKKARFLLLCIALCHSCLPETRPDGSIGFQAASPDELALVQAAQELGYLVMDRRSGILSIQTYLGDSSAVATTERYEILDVIDFSSKRKRMSVVVRFPDDRICIISKGADSILMPRLRLSALAAQKMIEIDERATRRKSMEVREAIARKSEAFERRPSHLHSQSRPSIGRTSISLSRTEPLRDQLDSWLSEREHDVDSVVADDASMYYEPRPSGQFGRPSMAPSETRSSMQQDVDFDLIEEALVIDEPAVIERCFQHINDFATEGLRTLLYCYRFVDAKEYAEWKQTYREAATSLVDRQARVEAAGELIERDFELAGATAIEDKLQKGVPETIDKLRRANIKMWMLTGDKRETAINIGHSCRLIKDYSKLVILEQTNGMMNQSIGPATSDIQNGRVAHSVVVVDGQTLSLIENDEQLKKDFFNLAIITDSVICCRASPSQKAGLVKAIRHKVKHSITLAIGDGANDIAMIQEAHVGIGITGQEGLQAARTSDYSIAQFRFLSKLLLVHGRWNYVRTCKYIAATFWKEMMFYLVQAMYQHYCGYTGTSLYENWSLSMFNTLFTSLPVIFLGIFERDLLPSTLLAVPELYHKGQSSSGFNFRIYLYWILLAVAEASIIFFTMSALYAHPRTSTHTDAYALGDLCFTAAVVVIATKLQLLEMHTISVANAVACGLSIGGWVLWNLILAQIYKSNAEYDVRGGFTTRFGREPSWWLTLVFAVACVWMLEVGVRAGKAAWIPSDTDVFQALERDAPTRRRFEEASWEELRGSREAEAEWRGERLKKLDVSGEEDEKMREAEIEEILRKRRDASEPRGKVSTSSARGRKHGFTKGWTAEGDAGHTRRSLGSRSRGRGGRKGREAGMSPPPIPTTRGILKKSRSLGDIERLAGRSELVAVAVGKGSAGGKGPQVSMREL